MLKHFRWNGAVGNNMLAMLSAIQLFSKLCKPILEDVHTDLSYLGNSWFKMHRKRLKEMSAIMLV